jgi:hypothetical protein
VSKSTVKRYLASLTPGTVAAAHEPTVAAENARVAIEFAERLNALDSTRRPLARRGRRRGHADARRAVEPLPQEPTDPKLARDDAREQLDGLADLEFLARRAEEHHRLGQARARCSSSTGTPARSPPASCAAC